jgi:hypothetical protein
MTRSALFIAATAIGAALTLAPPAYAGPMFPAAPPPCDTKFVYPTETFTLKQSNNIVVSLTMHEDGAFLGPASHTVAGKPDVTGGSVRGELEADYINFVVDWHNGVTNHYYGHVDPDGVARGNTLNNDAHEDGWFSLDKFTCAPFTLPGVQGPENAGLAVAPPPLQGPENSDLAVADPKPPPPDPKPVEGPNVSFETVLGGLVVHITDRSGIASQCVYTSDFVQRSFALPAKSTFDLRIVPAVPQFRNWDVSVSCDNGALTKTSTFF